MKMDRKVKKIAAILKSLSHEARMLIVCQLADGEKSVGELVKCSHLSQSAFSQHLGKLRREGIVRTRKRAQLVYYRIAQKEAIAVVKALHHIYC